MSMPVSETTTCAVRVVCGCAAARNSCVGVSGTKLGRIKPCAGCLGSNSYAGSHHGKADLSADDRQTMPQVSSTVGRRSSGELIPIALTVDRDVILPWRFL